MVIVEYCEYGNVLDFLLKHRKHFIDQIVRGPDHDTIDRNIQISDGLAKALDCGLARMEQFNAAADAHGNAAQSKESKRDKQSYVVNEQRQSTSNKYTRCPSGKKLSNGLI